MPIKNPTFPPSRAGAVFFFILLAFFAFLLNLLFRDRKSSATKTDLSRAYGVDKKTFCKWVKLYLSADISFAKFQKLQYVPNEMVFLIYQSFGFPGLDNPTLSKAQIVSEAGGNYRSLRQGVSAFPQKYGVSKEQFSKLNVFPPNVGQAILAQYQ